MNAMFSIEYIDILSFSHINDWQYEGYQNGRSNIRLPCWLAQALLRTRVYFLGTPLSQLFLYVLYLVFPLPLKFES